MDGYILNIITTITAVGIGSISVYAGLRNKIDEAKDAAQDAKTDVAKLRTQINDFTRFCDERHRALDKRINKVKDRR